MSNPNNVLLWLSRHEMTDDQKADLTEYSRIIHVNMTFPADSRDAVMEIFAKCEEVGATTVAGVFPAHVAVMLMVMAENPRFSHNLMGLLLPVSVPAPAKDGEVRGGGFVHHHWEYHNLQQ